MNKTVNLNIPRTAQERINAESESTRGLIRRMQARASDGRYYLIEEEDREKAIGLLRKYADIQRSPADDQAAYQVSQCDDGQWMVHTEGDVIAHPGQGNEQQKAIAICAALNRGGTTVGEWESTVQLWHLRNTVRDAIDALERNSTSAPVVECLKAALGVGASMVTSQDRA